MSGTKISSVDSYVPSSGRHYRRQYHWVPDGIYDHQFYQVRYLIKNGDAHTTISKMWLDKGGPEDCADDLIVAWGSYPDVPPKPKKI